MKSQIFTFYCPLSNKNSTELLLNEEESIHLIKVLRKKIGDLVNVFNGKGLTFNTQLVDIKKKHAYLKVLSVQKASEQETNEKLPHIVVAPPKSIHRISFLIEKLTELGVKEISFMQTDNSERKAVNIEKIEKTIIATLKQCKRSFIPKINNLEPFKTLTQKLNTEKITFASCNNTIINEKLSLKQIFKTQINTFLIGPEGDFSDKEITYLIKKNIPCVNINNFILRTETAAITITNCFNFLKN